MIVKNLERQRKTERDREKVRERERQRETEREVVTDIEPRQTEIRHYEIMWTTET